MKNLSNLFLKSDKTSFLKGGDKPVEKSQPKYVYDSGGITELLLDTVKKSIQSYQKKHEYSLGATKKEYDANTSKFSESSLYYRLHYFSEKDMATFGITDERIKTTVSGLSKNAKKKLNRLIYKLSCSVSNSARLVKLLNFVEQVGYRQYKYFVYNQTENMISTKRKEYRELVRYIKMDLPSELKRAREEYKKAKGDYYKKK